MAAALAIDGGLILVGLLVVLHSRDIADDRARRNPRFGTRFWAANFISARIIGVLIVLTAVEHLRRFVLSGPVGFFVMFAVHWCVGWAAQGFAHLVSASRAKPLFGGAIPSPRAVQTRWYCRLVFGLPPTSGEVFLFPAALQLMAVLALVVGGTIAAVAGPGRVWQSLPVVLVLYWVGAVFAYWTIGRTHGGGDTGTCWGEGPQSPSQ